MQNLNDNSGFSGSNNMLSGNKYAVEGKEASQKLDLSHSNANPFGAADSFESHSHKHQLHNKKEAKNSEIGKSKISGSKITNQRKDSDIITPKRTRGRQNDNSEDGSSFLSNFDELKSPLKNQNIKPIDEHFLDGGVSGFNAEMDSQSPHTESHAAMLQFIHSVA